jgi:DNA replication regulator DPB11
MAQDMGAEHKYDLTSDVTHLIIGYVDTAKYHYVARERPDVKVLLPAFVEAVRQAWMAGEESDIEALEIEHRAPTFYGLRICLTGFDNLEKRQQITQIVQQNGAEYHGDLTKHVTHLVAAAPEGKKYEYARKWNLKVVSEKWLHDSEERGMALNESLYEPTTPEEEQGKGAWNREPQPNVVLGKRLREDETRKKSNGANSKRKIRRTMSARLSGNQGNLWADIAGAPLSVSAPDNSGFQDDANAVDSRRKPAGETAQPEPTGQDSTASTVVQEPSSKPRGLFQGAKVYVHGFTGEKLGILQQHLSLNGADLITGLDEIQSDSGELENSFLIIPHDLPADKISPVPASVDKLTKVTEWWVESSLHSKTVVNPDSDRFCRPFANLSVQGKRRPMAI